MRDLEVVHIIYQRDKQKNKQTNTHFSSLADVRRQIATKFGMWIEHARTIFGPTLTLCPTSSFGARGLRKFGGNDPCSFVPTNLSFMNQIAPNFNTLRR